MDKDRIIAELAVRQDGLWTRRQAYAAQLSRHQCEHRVRSGAWAEVLPGIYRAASTPMNQRRHRRAALLWAGSTALVSHRSAAEVWGLEGVREVKPEITVTSGHPRHDDVIVHRSGIVLASDIRHVDGLRVAAPALTLVTLAGYIEEEDLEIAFESARRMRYVTVEDVAARLAPIAGRGRRGASDLRRLVTMLEGRPAAEYPLEVKVARALRASALPEPSRQHVVRLFGKTYRLDFAWPGALVALECDGRLRHSEDSDFQRDRARWSALAAAGWRIVFVTWRDVARDWVRIERQLHAALDHAA